ncbi:MAG TPA: S9 family peptidase [Vicinamibacterales bacterium]|nr:S9 family peptidase [Vicinamibacterales bacterium]
MTHRQFVVAALLGSVSLFGSRGTPLGAAPDQAAPGARLVSVRDTQNFATVGSPAISPDDRWVLYTQTMRDWDDAQWRTRTHIWRVKIDGTGARRLTYGDANTTAPAWFPDGSRLAFLSSRSAAAAASSEGAGASEGGGNQIHVMYSDGGEAWAATKHEGGVSSFAISPDGKKILFTAVDPLSAEDKRRRKERDDAEVVDETFRWTHLWYLDVESGKEKRLTEGAFVVSDPQWAPDSNAIAYVSRPTTKVDDAAWSDVWVTTLDGKPRKFYENAGPDTSPRWSPDGKTLAIASKTQAGNTQWYDKLHLFPAAGGAPKVLLKDFDLDFGTPIWSSDNKTVFWSTGQGTRTTLFGVDVSTGELSTTKAPMTGVSGAFELSHDNQTWVFSYSNGTQSSDLWAARRQGAGYAAPVRLTNANPWIETDKVQFGAVETIRWTNSEGGTIEGVLTRPVGSQPGTRYPLVVNPHGGPSSASTEGFSSANQLLAANGFLVLQVNFRGSTGYGQKHLNANQNTWGIGDYDDIMKGVDYVIAQGWADPNRMVAYGWSYGGYMTFWMSTQTDRFKLISPGAGLTNLYSMYSTTDIPAYLGWFFGTPWEQAAIYRKLSPIEHVKNVKSKILIMHGSNDARVPPTQADEFYRALKDLGKDVTYVRYPRQGHGITETRLAMDRLRRYVCAFTHAVGTPSTTESCRNGVPTVDVDAAAPRGGGRIDVDLPPSGAATGVDAIRFDRGIFEVRERADLAGGAGGR